jgi:2-polyprenyl-3-methyl-5-hydroxy-6-metoxy-1,4-benzoquinol methylase
MTDDRIKQFYKQTKSYIWDLGAWHLYLAEKRQSDLAMVQQMKDLHAKNIIDFGGGVGLNAIMMARAGFDVTLADLDSQTLAFAKFRAERHGVKLKFWKSDVEPAAPDAKYDVILVLDVLEHLPQTELATTVDKLLKLKTPKTQVIIHAPFGKTATHPMHLDETDETKRQVERLQTQLP